MKYQLVRALNSKRIKLHLKLSTINKKNNYKNSSRLVNTIIEKETLTTTHKKDWLPQLSVLRSVFPKSKNRY